MRVQLTTFGVEIIIGLKSGFCHSYPSVFQPKGRDWIGNNSSVHFGGDDFSDAEVDELIKGVYVLLGEALKPVERTNEFVLGCSIWERIDYGSSLKRGLVQLIHHDIIFLL